MNKDKSSLLALMRDDKGRFRTASLFYENYRQTSLKPIYTLKDYDFEVDGIVYPSLKLIYLSYDHVPGFEYEFAQDIFGCWEHWVRLTDVSRLRDEFRKWREELEIRIRANAMKNLITNSKNKDTKALPAAKYIANTEWKGTGRGRPSKEEIAREKRIAAGIKDELDADMERVGLSLIGGGKK